MLVDRLIAASQRKEVTMDSLQVRGAAGFGTESRQGGRCSPAASRLPPAAPSPALQPVPYCPASPLIPCLTALQLPPFPLPQERQLVPFFDSSEASATSFTALQPSGRRAASKPVPVPAHGLKRVERSSGHLAGSPPKKEAELVQARHQRRAPRPASSGGSAASGSASDTEMSSPAPSQQRKPRSQGKKGKGAPAAPVAPRASPARRRAEPVADLAALAAASAAAGAALRSPAGRAPAGAKAGPAPYKFAGPAFTNSPTPDCLPIPTSSLLLQVCAAGAGCGRV